MISTNFFSLRATVKEYLTVHDDVEKLALEHYARFDVQRQEAERLSADRDDIATTEDFEKNVRNSKK